MSRFVRWSAAVIILFAAFAVPSVCVAGTPTIAQDNGCLWIDPSRVDLEDAGTVHTILSLPLKRIIITVFSSGQTLYPSRLSLFKQMPSYSAKQDALKELLQKAHKRHIRIFAALDCFRWEPIGSGPDNPLEKRPDLAEFDARVVCGVPGDAKYASPFNPNVKLLLGSLVTELASSYPAIDGIVIAGGLPVGATLGYSDAARLAYIRDSNVDPLDLQFGSNAEDARLSLQWMNWRLKKMASCIGYLSSIYKEHTLTGKVVVVGDADWLTENVALRNTTLSDWPRWVEAGFADEVLLQLPSVDMNTSGDANNTLDAASIERLVSRLKTGVTTSFVVPVESSYGAENPLDQLELVNYQGDEPVAVRASDKADLDAAIEFLTSTLPQVQLLLKTTSIHDGVAASH